MITYDKLKEDEEIRAYIQTADETMIVMGYTEHNFAHVCKVAEAAGALLEQLGYSEREAELARVAGYLHDIGNMVNRADHAQSGALLAFQLLKKHGAAPDEIAAIVTAIGNHDEGTAVPVNPITAALILADKSDVRRSRVRNNDRTTFDIHDRVNYSVKRADLVINPGRTHVELSIEIETEICSVMDYFEIFLNRMILCKKAAEKLGLRFSLTINEQKLL